MLPLIMYELGPTPSSFLSDLPLYTDLSVPEKTTQSGPRDTLRIIRDDCGTTAFRSRLIITRQWWWWDSLYSTSRTPAGIYRARWKSVKRRNRISFSSSDSASTL